MIVTEMGEKGKDSLWELVKCSCVRTYKNRSGLRPTKFFSSS